LLLMAVAMLRRPTEIIDFTTEIVYENIGRMLRPLVGDIYFFREGSFLVVIYTLHSNKSLIQSVHG